MPKRSFSPCVLTLAVLAILSNLISADMPRSRSLKTEGASFIEIFVYRRTNAEKMSVGK